MCSKCYDDDMQEYVPTIGRSDLNPVDESSADYEDFEEYEENLEDYVGDTEE